MPVEDHPVHESTRHKAEDVNGCKNRGEFAPGYWAPNRAYTPDGRFVSTVKFIPHAMTAACRSFRLWDTDPACLGCTAPKDYAYRDKCLARE